MKTSGVSHKSIFCDRTVEVVFEVNAQFALRKIFQMTDGRQHLVIASQIFGEGIGFGGRFDDEE